MKIIDEDEFNIPHEHALTREMYAHFGLAAYLSQVFEKGIANLLSAHMYHEKKGKWSKKQYHAAIDNLDKNTLGQLLSTLKKYIEFDKNTEKFVLKAQEKRNYLVHNYFWENAAKIMFDDGKREIIQDLEQYQKIFKQADEIISEFYEIYFKASGISEDKMNVWLDKMVADEKAKYKKNEQ